MNNVKIAAQFNSSLFLQITSYDLFLSKPLVNERNGEMFSSEIVNCDC